MIAGLLGWLGAIGTFVAYVAVARGALSADSWRYAALNAVGGTLGAAASVLYGAWGAAFSNSVWALVGAHALTTMASERRRAQRDRLVTAHALDLPQAQDDVALCS